MALWLTREEKLEAFPVYEGRLLEFQDELGFWILIVEGNRHTVLHSSQTLSLFEAFHKYFPFKKRATRQPN